MSKRFEIQFVPYAQQRAESNNQPVVISLQRYITLPVWHQIINQANMSYTTPPIPTPAGDTFLIAGNAVANMNSNGMTQLAAVAGVDDTFAYVPLPFTFNFFGINYSNSNPVSAPAFYWNTNNVLGFGTGTNTIGWSANTGNGILIGNTDRRTNTFFYSALQTSGTTNYMNMLLWANNIYSDGVPNVIRYQIRFFRSPNNQYVELRINGFGATQGQWNITNGTAFQNTFGAYSASAGTSWVLRSDLNGNNWTFFNNYYINL
jgi:hypothetical protein